MKTSEIFTKAAQLVERGDEDYGCDAISRFESSAKPAVKGADIHPWMRYEDRASQVLWETYFTAEYRDIDGHASSVFFWGEDRDARVVGLCLLAAMCKSEGD
jgi:hypothetical protein